MSDTPSIQFKLAWFALALIAATGVTTGVVSFEFMTIFTLFLIAGFIDQHLQYK
jgi:hypothetical protein